MKARLLVLFALIVLPISAQLTKDQRLADFRNLVDLYARRYAGIQWKKSAVNFDLLNVSPWLSRVTEAKTDLEFYDVMVEYVSSLQDAHDQYYLPSDFEAYLDFSADLYDGKVLIDSINRKFLPVTAYAFEIGDELVSVDGKSAADWVKLFSKYVSGGNPRTTHRLAAELITDRYQGYYPWAHELKDSAEVVVLRKSGAAETYSVPWNKSGTPVTVLGASPGPLSSSSALRKRARAENVPLYRQILQSLDNYRFPGTRNVVGFGRLAPVFTLPATFVQRLGKRSYDSYYSGTFKTDDGTNVGFLRIPDFGYPSTTDLDKEIKFFQANTDVLVVDVMRNPGGSVCSAEKVLSRLSVNSFEGASAETRVTWSDILDVNYALADPYVQDDEDLMAQFTAMQTEYLEAFQQNQGRTKAMPICGAGATRSAAPGAYTKPVLVLIDEMSASAADTFAAMAQDNHIAPLFGYRTMGAGGSPQDVYAGVYSEGSTRVTRTLLVRLNPVVTPEFPTTCYVENVGVRPDIVYDYMTTDNLTRGGAAFVDAFTAAAVKLVKGI